MALPSSTGTRLTGAPSSTVRSSARTESGKVPAGAVINPSLSEVIKSVRVWKPATAALLARRMEKKAATPIERIRSSRMDETGAKRQWRQVNRDQSSLRTD